MPTSTEIDPDTSHPVIDLMPDQQGVDMGGTMRLGQYGPASWCRARRPPRPMANELIVERHRHRWEVNNRFRDELARVGLIVSGASPDNRLAEIMELRDHPFFVGVQFHPEFKSRPTRPHPLFREFVGAATQVLREGDQRPLPMRQEVDGQRQPVLP